MSEWEEEGLPGEILRDGRIPDFVKERLLDHPVRRRLAQTLEERPGMNKSQLCDELELDSNVLNHHLGKMAMGQLVVTRPSAQGKETLCFRLEDVILWEDERTRILFGREESRGVALYLAENPGATTREIAGALRLSPVTIRYHLGTLKEHQLVHRHPVGQTYVYEPDDLLEAWVAEIGGGFERPWDE